MTDEWRPHVIQQGEHVRKLAFRAGERPDAVWAHEKNAELAKRRTSMDVLHPGDVLHLPASPKPGLDVAVGTKNRFQAQVPMVLIHLELTAELANEPFEVHGATGGEPLKGRTDGDGKLSVAVPIWTREAEIRFVDRGRVLPVHVGDLDPIEEDNGVTQRLRQLGHLPPRGDDDDEARRADALRSFQSASGVEATGVADAATLQALQDEHGS